MGCAPSQVLAWLGATLSPSAFEVGPEVRAAFVDAQPEAASAFVRGRADRWHGDLQRLAHMRLAAAGVALEAIYAADACTASDPERFFSWRRDGAASGRMATLIWLH